MNMMVADWTDQIFQTIEPEGEEMVKHDSLNWKSCRVVDLRIGDYFRTFDPNTGRIIGTMSYIFYVHEVAEYWDTHDCFIVGCSEVATRIFG